MTPIAAPNKKLCTYPGPAGEMLVLQSEPAPGTTPGRGTSPGTKVKIDGVTGTYLPPGSLVAPGATSSSDPHEGVLTFIKNGYFVNIGIWNGTDSESQVEQVMSFVAPRLD